jgi:hypothetical protein
MPPVWAVKHAGEIGIRRLGRQRGVEASGELEHALAVPFGSRDHRAQRQQADRLRGEAVARQLLLSRIFSFAVS